MELTGKNSLGTLGLVFVAIAAIASPIGLVIMAAYGIQSIFYYALVIILFFIPSTLVCTEMGSAWPQEGGYYFWMKRIFGGRLANISLWLQWLGIILSFPVILAYVANLVAFSTYPSLAHNGVFIYIVAAIITIMAVIVSLLGIRMTFWISAAASLFGSIIPVTLIIVFSLIWLAMGHDPKAFDQSHHIVPSFSGWQQFSLLGATIFMFAGIEVAAYYMRFVKNARKKYPLAISIATIILILMSVLGTLAISVLVPADARSIVAGLFQAFNNFLTAVNMHWLIYIIFGMMFIGFMGVIANYLAATSQGLLVAAKDHFLPQWLTALNRFYVPYRIVVLQGVVTLLMGLLFLSKTVHSAYWQIEAIIGVGTSIRYTVFFIGGILMKYRFPSLERPLRVPGGVVGMWVVCCSGIAMCLFAGVMTFVPKASYAGALWPFEILLVVGTVFSLIVPYAIGEYSRYQARLRGELDS